MTCPLRQTCIPSGTREAVILILLPYRGRGSCARTSLSVQILGWSFLFPPFIDEGRHQRRPSRLMRCAEPGAILAMKVFVEQNVLAPVGVFLELPRSPIDRAPAGCVGCENADQAQGNLAGHLRKGDVPAVLTWQRHTKARA